MKLTTSRLARRGLLIAGAIVALVGARPAHVAPPQSAESVVTMHEARLRKLHLVRPDLINYPIASEIVC